MSDEKAMVTVNGRKMFIGGGGYFKTEVSLAEGENTIEVVAKRGWTVVTKTVTITYRPVKEE